MAAPISERAANVDGQVVTSWVALTSTGGTKEMAVSLAAGDPRWDIRIGHPILNVVLISEETDTTGTETFNPQDEMARAVSPDSTGEWSITDADTIAIYATPNQDAVIGFTYIAFGTKLI